MRTAIVWLLSAGAVLCSGGSLWAQAGRLPLPRLPGGGGRFLPNIHIPFFGHNYDLGIFLLWVVCLIVAMVVLAAVGYHLGLVLGGGGKRSKERGNGSQGQDLANPSQPEDIFCLPDAPLTGPAMGPAPAGYGPDKRDLILSPAEVAAKAGQTTRLMEFLAHQDPQLNPVSLRPLVTSTFCLVQHSWEARDYGPVSDLLRPGILAEHEGLLREMRKRREINRIDGLQVKGVDFVHLFCPEDPDNWEVAALITFEAAVYFVNDRTGAYAHGWLTPGLFQEFWVFRRQGEHWLLDAIERTHHSDLLEAANHVAGLSPEQLRNMEHSVAV
jgi:hypothetical protein